MAIKTLKAEKFEGFTDLPIYNRDTSWLKVCQNFRVMPGGYLQARAGFQELFPNSGTGADPISAGIYTGAHEHTTPDGFVYTAGTGGTVYAGNFAQRGQFELFSSSAEAQHDAVYIGSTLGKFSRVVFYIGQALAWATTAGTFAYEYPTAAAWDTDGATNSGTFTLTTTPDFTATGEQVLEVQDPGSAWVAAVRNGIYAYWIRIRLSSIGGTGIGTACRQGGTGTTVAPQKIYADWPGNRQIYVASANPGGGAGNGTLKYYGQSDGTTVAWQSVSTSLFSGNYPRTRFASYRGVLYFVNGKETKRWDGKTLSDIGFTAPSISSDAATPYAGGGTDKLETGVWLYCMSYGYGPGGAWGESDETAIGSAATTAAGGNNAVHLTWTLASVPEAAECIYIYRTPDLSSVTGGYQTSFPYYRIATIYRNAAGSFPSASGSSEYDDTALPFPFPAVDLNVTTSTPPTTCKFIAVHKNRLFLGGNNQYPGRVWWSEPFEAEAFFQDENFADFTRSTGGQLTGIIDFADQVVCFTEDKMFGIANVDQDQPSIYEIAVVGCIAPDSIASADGNLIWAARDGIYRWAGEGLPQRVSDDTSATFGKMSFESHGGSRSIIVDRLYIITPLSSSQSIVGSSNRWRYDLVTNSWSKLVLGSGMGGTSSTMAPLAAITAPLGHEDAGVRHSLWGVCDDSGTDFALYIGEWTESDAATAFAVVARVHFGPKVHHSIRPDKAYAVYKMPSGNWASVSITAATSAYIGTDPVIATSGASEDGTDYSLIEYTWTEPGADSNDYVISFNATSDTGTASVDGSEGKLLAIYLDADIVKDDGT